VKGFVFVGTVRSQLEGGWGGCINPGGGFDCCQLWDTGIPQGRGEEGESR